MISLEQDFQYEKIRLSVKPRIKESNNAKDIKGSAVFNLLLVADLSMVTETMQPTTVGLQL